MRHLETSGRGGGNNPLLRSTWPLAQRIPKTIKVGKVHLFSESEYVIPCVGSLTEEKSCASMFEFPQPYGYWRCVKNRIQYLSNQGVTVYVTNCR
jgi:hypothetical protein